MDFVVVDIEAADMVDDWSQPWLARMGSAVTYHPRDLFKVWASDEVGQLAMYLNETDLIVGYAISHYDLPVIEKLAGCAISPARYDLCEFVAKALNRRVRLDEVLGATLDLAKTGNGADAPKLFQQGALKELWAYNLNDVLLEYLLFRHARDVGYLLVEDRGRLIACPCPDPKAVATF